MIAVILIAIGTIVQVAILILDLLTMRRVNKAAAKLLEDYKAFIAERQEFERDLHAALNYSTQPKYAVPSEWTRRS